MQTHHPRALPRHFAPALPVLFVFLLGLPSNGESRAEFKGDFELLEVVADGIESTAAKIRTWEGDATITDHRGKDSSLKLESTSTVEFSFDAAKNAVRWNMHVVRTEGGDTARSDSSQMVLNGDRYEFGPRYPDLSPGPWMLWIKDFEQRPTEGLSDEFHPMYFLEAIRKGPMPPYLRSLHKESLDPPTTGATVVVVEVKREADLITLSYEYTGGTSIRYVFDATKGHNLVASVSSDSDEKWTYEFEIESFGEVWIPVRWQYMHEQAESGADELQTGFSREVRFTEQVVNKPLSDDAFTLERMGLKRGDSVNDHGLRFRFDPDDLQQDTAPGNP